MLKQSNIITTALALAIAAAAGENLLAQQPMPEAPRSRRQVQSRPTVRPTTRATVTPRPTVAATPVAEAEAKVAFDFKETSDTRVSIGYHIGPPLDYYEFKNNTLSWRESHSNETNSISVVLRENRGQQFLPGSKVSAGMTDPKGQVIFTTTTLGTMWHPEGMRYVANLSFASETTPTGMLIIQAEAPGFTRADKQQGAFFTQTLGAIWNDVKINPILKPKDTATSHTETGDFGEGRHAPHSPTPYPGATQ